MLNIFIFIAVAFFFTIIVGRLLERLRMPWIFAALIMGTMLAVYNPFSEITSSDTFGFLAELGMYFLLFIIGFEINLKKMAKKGKFLFKVTFFLIFLEAFFGTLVVHFVFGYGWIISFLVALSFATVGEAILIPILDEFKIVNNRLGQTIIGVGLLDDIVEVIALTMVVALVGSSVHPQFNVGVILVSLFILFALSFGLSKLKKESEKFNFLNVDTLFIFSIFILFLFLGIGQYAEATPLAAFLAGIGLRTFISGTRLRTIESEVKTLCYGFFAPIFFLWVGSSMNVQYVLMYPLLVIIVFAVSSGSKILGSLIITRKEMTTKESVMIGIGTSVRFSTSIIIIKILFDNGLIGDDIYSVVIASSIAFTFFVPVVFSNLLVRWKMTSRVTGPKKQ